MISLLRRRFARHNSDVKVTPPAEKDAARKSIAMTHLRLRQIEAEIRLEQARAARHRREE